ncbi:MAG: hypothetical protein HQ592_06685 [Planctomycetes bacterium]|nr:hypothetical protein [Planctomycetota bacterium]
MPESSDHTSASGFRLVRLLDGERREPGDIDIDRAIEASSSAATLDDLTRRGHSAVNVLDREKIAMLVSRAVAEAIEQRAEGYLAEERQGIEAESRRRFAELLTRYGRQASSSVAADQPEQRPGAENVGIPNKPPHTPGLSSIIADIIRTELNTQFGAGRLDTIERRVERLVDGLERAEQAFAGIINRQEGTQREEIAPEPDDKQQRAVLNKIFESNVQLQGVALSPENEI